jgi:hypothetical protein
MLRITSSRLSILAAAVAALGIGSFARADITDFTPGDLVVLQGGDAAFPDTATSTNEVPVFLDEYTPAGVFVGSVTVDASGDANTLTIPGVGSFQHEGQLSDSTDGNWMTFAGYNAAPSNTAGSAANLNASVGKRIGVVGGSASSLDTSTVVSSYGTGSANPFIRGAVTNGGSNESSLSFWTFGKYAANNATSNGGLAYVSGTGPTATTTTVEGFGDVRDVYIGNGQLYGGGGSSSLGTHGGYQLGNANPIGNNEPTTNLGSSQTVNTLLTNYSGGQSASAIALVNIPIPGSDTTAGTQNGYDVMYTIGDQGTPGIVKYYYNPTETALTAPGATGGAAAAPEGAWDFTDVGSIGLNATNNVLNPVGLIATVDPTNPDWVDLTVSGTNGVYTYIDKTGDPETAIPSSGGFASFTDLINAPTNEQFYGVATAVPEPASVGVIALGAMGLLARHRARRA